MRYVPSSKVLPDSILDTIYMPGIGLPEIKDTSQNLSLLTQPQLATSEEASAIITVASSSSSSLETEKDALKKNGNTFIVSVEDKSYATDYAYYLMTLVERCCFSEFDAIGKR